MKITIALLVPLLLCSCAGDVGVTRSSTPQPTRSASISGRAEVHGPAQRRDRYSVDRVYLVTRPGTENDARGEWRTQGATIRESGTRIEFVELTSGRTISFDAPHQVTPTGSGTSSEVVQDTAEQAYPTGRGGSASNRQ